MKLLLDTHVLLWVLGSVDRLSEAARDAIADAANPVAVSAASAWEIAIKRSLGKLDAPHDLLDALRELDIEALPIVMAHALTAGALPKHHRDPFDRMLVAQATVEGMTIVTADARIARYGVAVMAA